MPPLLASLVGCLALGLYLALSFLAGRARERHDVAAPATTGHPEFEKRFRVQQNTLEQIVIFLPALWLFAAFVNAKLGAAIGLVWVAARSYYAWSYYRDPTKREPGFVVAVVASTILLIGATIGIVVTGIGWL